MIQPREDKAHIHWDAVQKCWVFSYETDRISHVLLSYFSLRESLSWFRESQSKLALIR